MGLLISKYINNLFNRVKAKKLSKEKQIEFFQLLVDLLGNGFTLQESIQFMDKAATFSNIAIHSLQMELEAGAPLEKGLAVLGYNQTILVQLQFASIHGNIIGTLKGIIKHMKQADKQRKNVQKVLMYPCLLMGFLMMVIIGIRQFLLPQLMIQGAVSKQNIGIMLIQKSPLIFISILGITFLFILGLLLIRKKTTAFWQASFFSKLPFIASFYRIYISAFCALEWGKLFEQGLEINELLEVMKQTSESTLMKELSEILYIQLMQGKQLYTQISNFSFFTKELEVIMQHGEMKGKLGKELILYSQLCWERYFEKISRSIQWLQPIIFLLVAVLIIGVYAAMLLPIYSNMEGFL